MKPVIEKAADGMRAINRSGKLTQREYEASLNALNIFFGAIIGVSLGNVENMPTKDYVFLLVITAALVTMILLVSYSHRRFMNMIVLAAGLGIAWYDHASPDVEILTAFPDKLLPTLSVWAVMAAAVEFTERIAEPDTDEDQVS